MLRPPVVEVVAQLTSGPSHFILCVQRIGWTPRQGACPPAGWFPVKGRQRGIGLHPTRPKGAPPPGQCGVAFLDKCAPLPAERALPWPGGGALNTQNEVGRTTRAFLTGDR